MKKLLLLIITACLCIFAKAQTASPPGVTINHISQQEGKYIGSPCICILPDGTYLASHDEFGPNSTELVSAKVNIFSSSDKGKSWKQIARLDGQYWSTMFVLNGHLYIIGPQKNHGNLVIRRSDDGGYTWTIPTNSKTGIILTGQYHTAPVPVVIHNGRVWRAIENAASPDKRWPQRYSAMIISARINSDLLKAKSWRQTNFIRSDSTWMNNHMNGWLEGNAVVAPDGSMLDILRSEIGKSPTEYAAYVHISKNGKKATFDPNTGFVKFPGGRKKFTIRYDNRSKLYWTLSNPNFMQVPQWKHYSVRNMLVLSSSPDLNNWTMHKMILFHPERLHHAFQYIDWLVENNDIIFVSRTAFDDSTGGAHTFHDANFLTFHRIENFRDLKDETLDLDEYTTNENK